MIYVDNYVLDKDIIDILNAVKTELTNGKLSQYRRTRSGIQVTCPSHANGHESKPSCYIREKDGLAHCFSCGAVMPFQKFIAECMDCSEDYASRWLIENFGTKVSEKFIIGEDIDRNSTNVKYKAYVDKSILSNSHFQDWTPYFKTRGLTHDTIKSFGVKYDPTNKLAIFPCYDIKGNLVMLHTRSIETKRFHLDADIPKPLFGIYDIIKNNIKKAIVTEGPFDAMKATQFGFPACATLGNLSDSQIDQINESGIEILYIMFDNDAAGRAFAEDLKSKIKKTILIYEPQIPNGKKDIGDLDYEEFWSSINNCDNSIITIKKSKLIIV